MAVVEKRLQETITLRGAALNLLESEMPIEGKMRAGRTINFVA